MKKPFKKHQGTSEWVPPSDGHHGSNIARSVWPVTVLKKIGASRKIPWFSHVAIQHFVVKLASLSHQIAIYGIIWGDIHMWV